MQISRLGLDAHQHILQQRLGWMDRHQQPQSAPLSAMMSAPTTTTTITTTPATAATTTTTAAKTMNSFMPSIIKGRTSPPLQALTLSGLLDRQTLLHAARPAIIVPWTGARLTYLDMQQRTLALARGLLALGLRRGERVGILCGDDERFVELLFACARIGVVLVILNKTYTAGECVRALRHTEPRALFIADRVNHQDAGPVIRHIQRNASSLGLKDLVLIRDSETPAITATATSSAPALRRWQDVLESGKALDPTLLAEAERQVHCDDVANMQFTSGTTGDPKAVMLTHFGLVNNAIFIGDCLNLTPRDVVCCPPPLFHCFGLVAGMLATLAHGGSVVYAGRDFDAKLVANALVAERCTVLHGVPTMFSAILEVLRQKGRKIDSIRTGIAAGSKVPPPLVAELRGRMGFKDTAITYGMTETSPASFMTVTSDTLDQKLETVGRVLPHTSAKVVDRDNRVLPRGSRGELCIAGYLVHEGYYQNAAKTAEAMKTDEDGVLWMHTGDEAEIDEHGYCRITGRLKDIIIRGGENIYPDEIEVRLLQHEAVNQASIVGVKDEKYGEAVAAFLQCRPNYPRPLLRDLVDWVRATLAPQKAPRHLFWVGAGEALEMFPVTGSGKVRKDVLREVANRLLGSRDGAGPRGSKL